MSNETTKIDPNCSITKRHIREAKAVGLTLLGSGKDRKYRTYHINKCEHIQQFQVGHVKENNFRCSRCLDMKLSKEAKAQNLSLLTTPPGSKLKSQRLYRFNECEHEQVISPANVRKGKDFKCNECFEIKLNKEAKDAGLRLIAKGKNTQYRRYRFLKCAHEREITTGAVRKGKDFKCNECFEIKLNKEAKDAGLRLIGKANNKNANYRQYEILKCLHRQDITTSNARTGGYYCSQCQVIKHAKEASAGGLTLVEEGKDSNYRVFSFNECGHIQEIHLSAVRDGNFVCNTCEETSRDLPSEVYMLKIVVGSFSYLKLGYTNNLIYRIKRYKLPESASLSRVKILKFKKGRDAHQFESFLHIKYKANVIDQVAMQRFHPGSGSTECYPLDMLDTLMDELELKETQLKSSSDHRIVQ
jgi:predicted adenine nucleotide alpha hydrolase (AANH) superfamily ATPase